MKRLDLAMVEWGLAPSRAKAQGLIAEGAVQVLRDGEWVQATDNSLDVARIGQSGVRVAGGAESTRYVSRGGLKLESALNRLNLDIQGLRVLDIGLSTGGFTDVLLKRGAAAVLGVDVGRDQLHPRLKSEPRLTALEGFHVRDLASDPQACEWLKEGCPLAVVDVSFISLEHVFPVLAQIMSSKTQVLALVKPQFEVGPRRRAEGAEDDVRRRVLQVADKYGFSTEDYFASEVKGQDGTQEFFILCRRR